MRTYDEICASAKDEPAFSNHTMWSIWSHNWCNRCRNEPTDPDEQINNGCPLITVAVCGQRTPIEWMTESEEQRVIGDYTCIEFRDVDDGDGDPTPEPDPIPGQGDLFPREPFVGTRMFADVVTAASDERVEVWA